MQLFSVLPYCIVPPQPCPSQRQQSVWLQPHRCRQPQSRRLPSLRRRLALPSRPQLYNSPPSSFPKPRQWLCVLLHPKRPPRLCPQPAPPHSRRRRPVWHRFLALNPFLHLVQSLPVPMPLFPRLQAPLQAAAVENTVGKVQIRSGGRSPARWSKSCEPKAMLSDR